MRLMRQSSLVHIKATYSETSRGPWDVLHREEHFPRCHSINSSLSHSQFNSRTVYKHWVQETDSMNSLRYILLWLLNSSPTMWAEKKAESQIVGSNGLRWSRCKGKSHSKSQYHYLIVTCYLSLVSGLMQTLHLKTGAQVHPPGKAGHSCQQISLLPTIVSFPLLLTCLPTAHTYIYSIHRTRAKDGTLMCVFWVIKWYECSYRCKSKFGAKLRSNIK